VLLGAAVGPAAGLLALVAPSSGDAPNQCTALLEQMRSGKAPKTVK
jgi:gas vesicle protein